MRDRPFNFASEGNAEGVGEDGELFSHILHILLGDVGVGKICEGIRAVERTELWSPGDGAAITEHLGGELPIHGAFYFLYGES